MDGPENTKRGASLNGFRRRQRRPLNAQGSNLSGLALTCLISLPAVLVASAGRCDGERPVPPRDPVQVEQLLNCDRLAEREAALASKRTPIAPVSILSPILLLNDLNQRKQEEANQPALLEQIELKRQQCRKDVVALAARRAQEVIDQKSDVARGYKSISFETFALDAKSLAATQARISMRGSYLPDGNLEWLFPSHVEALQARYANSQSRNIPRVPLVTEDASREFRRILLKCKSTPGSDHTGCPTVITGQVSLCSITGPLGSNQDIPCIVVANGRTVTR